MLGQLNTEELSSDVVKSHETSRELSCKKKLAWLYRVTMPAIIYSPAGRLSVRNGTIVAPIIDAHGHPSCHQQNRGTRVVIAVAPLPAGPAGPCAPCCPCGPVRPCGPCGP